MPGDATCLKPKSRSRRGFNPRPAFMPGDAMRHCFEGHFHAVSIRARHSCRAMRAWRRYLAGCTRGFNPRPAFMPGDAPWTRRKKTSAAAFQSAPGIHAGRCRRSSIRKIHSACFNPRPAFMPGDAIRCQVLAHKWFFGGLPRTSHQHTGEVAAKSQFLKKFYENHEVTNCANQRLITPALQVRAFKIAQHRVSDSHQAGQSTNGPSKSTALKTPCSITSKPRVPGIR